MLFFVSTFVYFVSFKVVFVSCKCCLGSRKCNLFVGDWVSDSSQPMYTNESCHVIEPHQNCMKNGKPDLGYLYWRWTPKECELPKFNGNKFLSVMRNKAMAFVGDSISRNHVQSLLCMLSQVFLTFLSAIYNLQLHI